MKPTSHLFAVAIFLGAGSLQSAVIADFSGGNGTSNASQYQGTSGDGWTTAWTTTANAGGGTLNGTVSSANPLSGGGNYLSLSLASAGNPNYVTRTWDSSAVSYTTAPVTISWEFRLDSPIGQFDQTSDQIGFLDGASGQFPTFQINAFGATQGSAVNDTWAFYNGTQNNAGFNASNYVSTGITLVTGTVYSFSVTLDPSTRTWVGSVSDGTNSFTSAPLGFRTNQFSAGGTVQFGMRESNVGDNITYSLDSIEVVPEPSVCVMAGMGVGSLLFRRRRPKKE